MKPVNILNKLNESSYERNKKKQIEDTLNIIEKIADKVGNNDYPISYPHWRSGGYCSYDMSLDNNTVRLSIIYNYKKHSITVNVAPNVSVYNANKGYYAWLEYNSVEETVNGVDKAVKIARGIVDAVKSKDSKRIEELAKQLKSMKGSNV